ncbi:MAG TPA: porphobilinogen synthase [Verrucomicrobiales bacterium]|nr:porphobilinogen synthase [Verrucomicrobiales bacterium]|tara:strand:+ start:1348 stop:2355 length:1008 start_codon:yes stop_codon:yes gene_type:complete
MAEVFPQLSRRPRRLRRNASVRALVQETQVTVDDFIYPLFVREGEGAGEPVPSMPGVERHKIEGLVAECRAAAALGIKAVALFPVTPVELKDERGTEALNPDCLVLRAVKAVKAAVPDLVVITDVALDPYTNTGHDGVLNASGNDVDNDTTVEILAKMAVVQADAGVDWVAPSDMMDGRVGAIRSALDAAGHTQVAILAYSAKYASAFYGPFRDAVGSQQAVGKSYLDKKTYQLNPANPRESIMEAALDIEEGADVLMVKPAGAYLDILCQLWQLTDLPLAAYQVSGEYAQIHAAAEKGWLDYAATRDESLLAIKRAGASLILTYFAKEIAEEQV